MKRLCYILILLSMISCYSVKNGKPIPWFDNYKLKDKNTIIPKTLDTNNIYKLKKRYIFGKLVYSDSVIIDSLSDLIDKSFQNGNYYLKFFSDGRCQSFTTKRFDKNDYNLNLSEEDLNPENYYCQYKYYYFTDSTNFQMEYFSKGDGGGTYIIMDYLLKDNGMKILSVNDFLFLEYELFEIPSNWKKYNYSW